ncbi:MAG TPA: hypothetical protein VGB93_08230, partial [Methylovirgula sp.]
MQAAWASRSEVETESVFGHDKSGGLHFRDFGNSGRAHMGNSDTFEFWATSFVGIGGSIVGGLIARIFSRPRDGAFFHPAGFFLSI